MANTGIENAARLGWYITPTSQPEQIQYAVHTAKRDSTVWDTLLDVIDSFPGDLGGGMAPFTLNRITYSEWDTGPGFEGWHQRLSRDVTITGGTGTPLPHQLCAVLGWRNTSDFEFPLGRRRNRMYLGPLQVAVIGSDSRMTTTYRNTFSTTLGNLHTALSAVASDLGVPAYEGLAVVSPAAGLMFDPNQITAGLKCDVQRRRAEHTPESPTYSTIE
jgi:hypothetical protein